MLLTQRIVAHIGRCPDGQHSGELLPCPYWPPPGMLLTQRIVAHIGLCPDGQLSSELLPCYCTLQVGIYPSPTPPPLRTAHVALSVPALEGGSLVTSSAMPRSARALNPGISNSTSLTASLTTSPSTLGLPSRESVPSTSWGSLSAIVVDRNDVTLLRLTGLGTPYSAAN